MAWHWAVLAARHIPWKTVIANAPRVANAARQLYESNQPRPDAPPPGPASVESLTQQVEALQRQNNEQSRLIGELAQSMEGLAQTVATLRARLWLAAAGAAAALVLAVIALLF